MAILDRYVLVLFFKVLLVAYGSVAGLFVVIETFNNLEEFIELGRTQGGILAVMQAYFGPRLLSLFDRTSAMLALMAAVFTLTWLHRTSELTAIMAAGIPRSRMAKPLLYAAIGVAVVAILARELVLPQFGQALVRNAQSWDGRSAPLHARYDYRTGVFLNGAHLVPRENRIMKPQFRLPIQFAHLGTQIDAVDATYQRGNQDHPAGYLLRGVTEPKSLLEHPSLQVEERLVVALPSDQAWLEADQVFVPSEVDTHQLEVGDALKQYASTWQLTRELRNPGLDYGANLKRVAHHRLLQPFLDISLFLVGLPLVVGRSERHLLLAAGSALGVLILFYVIGMVADGAADAGWLEPYQAAWLPLMLFVPWAVWAYPRLDR